MTTRANSHLTTMSGHVENVLNTVEKYANVNLDGNDEMHTVISSWRRCVVDHGLEPHRNSRSDAVIDASQLRCRREQLGELYKFARAEMEDLTSQIAGSGFLLALADSSGALLDTISDSTVEYECKRAGILPGAIWREEFSGTGGIGTCIVERRPITIHRDEHFFACSTELSCSVAPIFGPHGDLLAVLNATSVTRDNAMARQSHTVALLSKSVQTIEVLYFLSQCKSSWILRFDVRSEFIGLSKGGMLAIDDEGLINAVNSKALLQLGINSSKDVIGKSISHIFDLSAGSLHNISSRLGGAVWPVHDRQRKTRYFATLRPPLKNSRIVNIPKSEPAVVSPIKNDFSGAGKVDLDILSTSSDSTMLRLLRCAQRVMNKDIVIMLRGETGTGKEIVAQAIHNSSSRSNNKFVAVNCAAIPDALIESELFGYKAGAFTGARREGMRGKILQANGGTLFLDEIGDMPVELQTRLLRVLEEREVLPLGGNTPTPVDLHVISATHCNLSRLVEEECFRKDLYYRLNGVTLELPPLRERDDKKELIRGILASEAEVGIEVGIHDDAFSYLASYEWPGNIRELRNTLRTALALSEDGVIRVTDLPPEIVRLESTGLNSSSSGKSIFPDSTRTDDTLKSVVDTTEREKLLAELKRHDWNITNAAKTLGVSRMTIYRKMQKYHIASNNIAAFA